MSESTVIRNCSHTINLPGIVKTDSWGTDPGQILQPSLDSAMSDRDRLEFSGIPDGQASGFARWLDSINHWPIRDMGCLDNCWEHLDMVASKKGLAVDLLAGVCEEQAIDSCWEESQETDHWFWELPRMLALRAFLVPKTMASTTQIYLKINLLTRDMDCCTKK